MTVEELVKKLSTMTPEKYVEFDQSCRNEEIEQSGCDFDLVFIDVKEDESVVTIVYDYDVVV